MNSITYLDSVLTRSFSSSSRSTPPSKRSRSHSSLPGSRRPSKSTSSTPGRSSSHRRLYEDGDSEPDAPYRASPSSYYPYNAKLRRTGSTPADVYASRTGVANHTDDDEDASSDDSRHALQAPRPRWSALWGLTGWIDEAINPSGTYSARRSRKNSSATAPPPIEETSSYSEPRRSSRRVPSLDDLLMGSSAPPRKSERRTASSGSSPSPVRRYSDGISGSRGQTQTDDIRRPASARRRRTFGQIAGLTMTGAETLGPHQDERDLMSEKEREDIVEFDGGDFAPEEYGPVTLAQHESDSHPASQHARQESLESDFGGSEKSLASIGSGSVIEHHASGTSQYEKQAQASAPATPVEEKEAEQLLQSSGLSNHSDDEKVSEIGSVSVDTIKKGSQTPTPPPYSEDDNVSLSMPTPSVSRRGSRRSSVTSQRKPALDLQSDVDSAPASSSSSSVYSSQSDEDEKFASGTRHRKRSSRSSVSLADVSEASTSSTTSSGWLAARPPSRRGSISGASVGRRRRFSPIRTFRKALIALRDAIFAILLCPIRCLRVLTGRKKGIMVEAIPRDVPVLLSEKSDTIGLVSSEYDDDKASIMTDGSKTLGGKERKRPPSLRFTSTTAGAKALDQTGPRRPRTPKPSSFGKAEDDVFTSDSKGDFSEKGSDRQSEGNENEDEEEEPLTEEQAIAIQEKRRLRQEQRQQQAQIAVYEYEPSTQTVVKSRLLPNPHPVDPMLAHDRNARPVDERMAREEARIQAEREAKVAARRAARRGGGVVQQTPAAVVAPLVPRGPSIIHHSPKTLVLDLDETLIHSTSRSPLHTYSSARRGNGGALLGLESLGAVLGLRANENPRRIRPHMVEVVLDGRSVIYHVYKRPWVDYFLRKVASWYHVVIFTASVQEYADPVIDWLDQGRGLISGRLFREACTFKDGSYVKNLELVERDLATVCLVDNSPASYAINQANGIPVEGWTHDPNDEALLDLLPVLDSLRFATDVRHILGIRGFSA